MSMLAIATKDLLRSTKQNLLKKLTNNNVAKKSIPK